MKNLLITSLLAIGIVTPAIAQETIQVIPTPNNVLLYAPDYALSLRPYRCGTDYEKFTKQIVEPLGLTQKMRGVTAVGSVMTMYLNEESGIYVFFEIFNDGAICLVNEGEHIEIIETVEPESTL